MLCAFALAETKPHLAGLPANILNFDGGMQSQVRLRAKNIRKLSGNLLVDLRENARLRFKQRDARTEVLKHLRHLHANGTGADDRQTLRRLRQVPDGV